MGNMHLYQSYQETEIETASPEKLIMMLYDGLLRNIIKAKSAIEKKEISPAHDFIIKAQRIVQELQSSLNRDAGEVSKSLFRLYDYTMNELVEANLKKDIRHLNNSLDVIKPIRDAWFDGVISKKTDEK